MNHTKTQEIKRLLKLSEVAQEKVRFNHKGTKVVNPAQQSVASRLYNKAYKIADSSNIDILPLHKEVINEMRKFKKM